LTTAANRRRLISSAHVPVILPARFAGKGTSYHGKFSYYESRIERPDFDTVYLRFLEDLPHELGHVFDRKTMTMVDRAEVTRVLKIKKLRPWFWGEMGKNPETWMGMEPLEEIFAEAYADAFLHPKRRKELRRWLYTKVA
jgi:hypothetical protein